MVSSIAVGFMAVFAVSGSVVFVAHQVHKHLLSDFMKKLESELGIDKHRYQFQNRRVRFVDEQMDEVKEYHLRRKKIDSAEDLDQILEMEEGPDKRIGNSMPLNRQVLYKGIIEYRALKGQNVSNFM